VSYVLQTAEFAASAGQDATLISVPLPRRRRGHRADQHLRWPPNGLPVRNFSATDWLDIGLSARDLRRAGTTLRPRLTETHDNHAVFADDITLRVSTVVRATGFHRDHSWINIPEALDGHLRHARGITPAAGLYVLGQSWQHTAGSALLGFVHHDAAHLAAHITARSRSSNP
jgi:hypothetical protein